MPTFLLFCVIVIFSSSSLAHPPHFNNLTDRRSLLEFKAALTNDPSRALANWNPNISFCGWRGVTCSSRRQRVVAINLPGMHLEGAISPFLANLSFLRWLDLSENHLHGVIPPQLGRLFRLRALSLSRNALEGAIPNSIPLGCRYLEELLLSFNSLSGRVPGEVGLLAHVKIVYLGANNLTGTIPSSLGNLSALAELDLGENNLEGTVPVELGCRSRLLPNPSNDIYSKIMVLVGKDIPVAKISSSLVKLGDVVGEMETMLERFKTITKAWDSHLKTAKIPPTIMDMLTKQVAKEPELMETLSDI